MEKPLLHYDDTTGNTPHPGYWVTWSKLSPRVGRIQFNRHIRSEGPKTVAGCLEEGIKTIITCSGLCNLATALGLNA